MKNKIISGNIQIALQKMQNEGCSKLQDEKIVNDLLRALDVSSKQQEINRCESSLFIAKC